jgi:hypothetical protein
MRPRSMVLFERLYLGALALYLLNAVVHWSYLIALQPTPPTADSELRVGLKNATLVLSLAEGRYCQTKCTAISRSG